jgi:hypothetical protein
MKRDGATGASYEPGLPYAATDDARWRGRKREKARKVGKYSFCHVPFVPGFIPPHGEENPLFLK